jgi:formate hydrogenlyase subunit 6/NADH:ubiquinone oxidoreductase subunit I
MSKRKIRPGAMIAMVLRSLFQKPATVDYPAKPLPMPEAFRGQLKFDPSKCIGCLLCMKDCPSNAIQIKKIADKKFEMDIDLGKCIYCGQCVDSCVKKALAITPRFELAQTDRDKLKIIFDVAAEIKPDPEAGA